MDIKQIMQNGPLLQHGDNKKTTVQWKEREVTTTWQKLLLVATTAAVVISITAFLLTSLAYAFIFSVIAFGCMLAHDCIRFRAPLAVTMDKVKSVEAKVIQLENDVAASKSANTEYQEQITLLKTEHQEQIVLLKQEIDRYKTGSESIAKPQEELVAEVKMLQAQIKQLKQTNADLEKTNTESNETITRLNEQRIIVAESEVDDKEKQRVKLRDQHAKTMEDLEEYKQKITALEKGDQKALIEQHKQEIEDLKEQYDERVDDLTKRLNRFLQQESEHQREVAGIQGKYDAQIQQLQEELNTARTNSKTMSNAASQLNDQITQLEKQKAVEVKQLHDQIAALQKELNKKEVVTQDAFEQSEEGLENLNMQIDEASARLHETEQFLADNLKYKDSLEQEIKTLEENKTILEDGITKLQEQWDRLSEPAQQSPSKHSKKNKKNKY